MTLMPRGSRSLAGPMPLWRRSLGESKAPALMMTSFVAVAVGEISDSHDYELLSLVLNS